MPCFLHTICSSKLSGSLKAEGFGDDGHGLSHPQTAFEAATLIGLLG